MTQTTASNADAGTGAGKQPSLLQVRRTLEGVIPPAMCSVSADGVPHVAFLSHAEYIDPEHVALTFQFFNRSRANVLATGRIAMLVEDPISGVGLAMQLQYLRTETEGPVFERLRAKLAGIAAHSGMDKVFKLQGADLYRVLELKRVDGLAGTEGLASAMPRCDLNAGVRALSQRLADCTELPQLLDVAMRGLQTELRIDHAILWLLDGARQSLFTLASTGYDDPGTGAEMPLADAGLAGVAVREGVPVRIGHMTTAYIYGSSWRERARSLGLDAVLRDEIPLPGLERPCSQLAVPLRARGRSVGALLVESERDQFFSYDDEDALSVLGAQIAQALAALQRAELDAVLGHGAVGDSAAGTVNPTPAAPQAQHSAAPLVLRHYPRDDSLFLDDRYLIKGVAGAILWKLAGDLVHNGRSDFTTRELRLGGDALGLPDVQDNLGVRLLLLERRLADRDAGLAIQRTGRGRFRLLAQRPLELVQQGGG